MHVHNFYLQTHQKECLKHTTHHFLFRFEVKYVGIHYFTGIYTFVFPIHHQMSSGPPRSCKAYISQSNIYSPILHTGQCSVRQEQNKKKKKPQYTDCKDGLNYCFKTRVSSGRILKVMHKRSSKQN